MYKRRDWLHVHGADGGQTSDSDSSDESQRSSQGTALLGSCRMLAAWCDPARQRGLRRLSLPCAGDGEADGQASGSEAEGDAGDGDGVAQGLYEENSEDDDGEDGSDNADEDPDAAGVPCAVRQMTLYGMDIQHHAV